MRPTLAIRVHADRPNHHLWNNHGTWWCHYTVRPTPHTRRRVRVSLGTTDLEEARELRDLLLRPLREVSA
jgi:predicted deacetylase